jgi:hypothetical protein
VDYLAMVYTLVTAVVLGVAGIVLLSHGVWNHAKDYARARKAMDRALPLSAEPLRALAISRTLTQSENADRSRAA